MRHYWSIFAPELKQYLTMTLSDRFWEIFDRDRTAPAVQAEARALVEHAAPGPERSGLLALIHHDGIGADCDLDTAFTYAEEGARGADGLALYILAHMCEHAETPDQAEGGPRQKYDHYDAERFMTLCAATTSSWAAEAHLWLGHYFMDSARGGDPEEALEHFSAIADNDLEAAGALADYYWAHAEATDYTDHELNAGLFAATLRAVRLAPDLYSLRAGMMYAYGLGCEPDVALARKYLEEARADGFTEAAEHLARLDETDSPARGED